MKVDCVSAWVTAGHLDGVACPPNRAGLQRATSSVHGVTACVVVM